MTFSIYMRDNIQSFVKGLKTRANNILLAGDTSVKSAAEFGAAFMRTIVPKDTTALMQAIHWTALGGTKDNPKAQIRVLHTPKNQERSRRKNPAPHDDPAWYGWMMNYAPGWGARIKTGNPYFINATKRVVKSRFKQNLLVEFEKLK